MLIPLFHLELIFLVLHFTGFVGYSGENIQTQVEDCGYIEEVDGDIRTQVPWTAAIFIKTSPHIDFKLWASGIVISDRAILVVTRGAYGSSKEKMTDRSGKETSVIKIHKESSLVVVGLPTTNLKSADSKTQVAKVTQIVEYKGHEKTNHQFHYSVLVLKHPLNLTTPFARAICLNTNSIISQPISEKETQDSRNNEIYGEFRQSGYGIPMNLKYHSPELKLIKAKSLPFSECDKEFKLIYKNQASLHVFCGQAVPGRAFLNRKIPNDICFLHGGGAVMKLQPNRWFLVGITALIPDLKSDAHKQCGKKSIYIYGKVPVDLNWNWKNKGTLIAKANPVTRKCIPLPKSEKLLSECFNPRTNASVDCKNAPLNTMAKLKCDKFYISSNFKTSDSRSEMECTNTKDKTKSWGMQWTPYRVPHCTEDCGVNTSLLGPNAIKTLPTSNKFWFPWHAAIFRTVGGKKVYTCGATLIESRVIVTAADCVTQAAGDPSYYNLEIIFAPVSSTYEDNLLEDKIQIRKIKSVWLAPGYDSKSYHSNLAIVELSEKIVFGRFIRPACYYQHFRTPVVETGTIGRVPGFYKTATFEKTSSDLIYSILSIVPPTECNLTTASSISEFCAAGDNDNEERKQDSPLSKKDKMTMQILWTLLNKKDLKEELNFFAGNSIRKCSGFGEDKGGGFVIARKIGKVQRYTLKGVFSRGVGIYNQHPSQAKHTKIQTQHCKASSSAIFINVDSFKDWITEKIEEINTQAEVLSEARR